METLGEVLGGKILSFSVVIWEALLTVLYLFKLVEFTALLGSFFVLFEFYFADFSLESPESGSLYAARGFFTSIWA